MGRPRHLPLPLSRNESQISRESELMSGLTGLDEKNLADLEALARDLREQLARNPQHPRIELQDVEWEIEKRSWRKPA